MPKDQEPTCPSAASSPPKAQIESALQRVASGTAKLFGEQSPFELGTEIGATLEWSQLGSIKYEPRGAANETGWDHNLPYDAATLKRAVLSFWDSLPPNVQNQMMPPLTHPDADEDETEPE